MNGANPVPGGMQGTVGSDETSVFPGSLDLEYLNVERGEGVWLQTTDGRRILDACSGGTLAACLGHGIPQVVEAADAQARRIAYYYNHQFTSEPQERLADRLLSLAPEMARVRFVSGGSEANETALQLARLYHVERGDEDRWRVFSTVRGHTGSTMGALALSGDRSVREPYEPYLATHLHVPPAAWRADATGAEALAAIDRGLEAAGPETIAAFFCEAVSASAPAAWGPTDGFWHGLEERRRTHGFLVCVDDVATGVGRVGSWLSTHQLPIEPDIVTLGSGLGAGHAPLGAVLCRQHVYDALDRGSREFDLGHTWDGAPLPSAVGLAVLDVIEERDLLTRVHDRGPDLRDQLASAMEPLAIVREVRGRGFLLGVALAGHRDLPFPRSTAEDIARLVDDIALEHELLVRTVHAGNDPEAGVEMVLAPAFTSTDDELAEMLERAATVLERVQHSVDASPRGTP
ncbi:MAG: aminotransferase class III-fold pyridoxal phosphate-dependent enzyme [Actinomycetota bacterium]|nr:aminotransferase class III-fold pyridoxal phosphate-dependent enzyme [Actinomycetota bacterium]MDH5224820.1 aminotransferase class III-fold pyridoxal phosphate-dependent enzyme [Actinomycetota bacterium]MDH5312697.1 aminotransferase class III-fold pyridoxal phosphate-dependent enzyme [Actinomycetota bacterium]